MSLACKKNPNAVQLIQNTLTETSGHLIKKKKIYPLNHIYCLVKFQVIKIW